ncbi:Bug family tripartite tricarboxylate transporter substrate binding protein [Advenella mimigardefordensis]|uniref:Putative Bug-like extracytoplasmic solute binding receptor, TTT family n=1 Tax=Advenella mimigardefordensis (strain DSM 17166 / LMG 22922 / DPN7) TaxID=1247726 RepID=W0PFC0_ADVMD|nr:tripartite tricarboxylate transporter substrate-binding protein [Advenella mimigardefordensis]AHG65694.1 putative Bug-like extracytoplasmic solute binding receptor, TTT family [Advenella mimigardefordensis DPN7]
MQVPFKPWLLAVGLLPAALTAWAQPSKFTEPVTLTVGYVPGGASDNAARIVAKALSREIGVPVIVENKPGGGGRIAAADLKNTKKGRNVLMLGNPAVTVIAPIVFSDLNYNPQTDFKPVALVTDYSFALGVPASSKVESVEQFVEWAKANPKQLNIGVPATGSLPHFFGLMLADKLGLKPEIVGYKGSSQLLTDLAGGNIPVAIDTLDTFLPMAKSGKVKVLGVSSDQRDAGLPDVPPFHEAGIDIRATGWNAVFAPASMDDDVVTYLGDAISKAMGDATVQNEIRSVNLVPVQANAAQTRKAIDAFRQQWEPVVRASGFKVNK